MASLQFFGCVGEISGNKNLLEDRVMHNGLDHFGLLYHQLHASGHMSRKELTEAVKIICPRRLFPVHIENPNLCKRFFDPTILPEKGKRYML